MIALSPEEIVAEAAKKRDNPVKEKDAAQLAEMLIYHGKFRTNPLLKTKNESWALKGVRVGMREEDEALDKHGTYNTHNRDHWYGCRYIQLNGDCGIYETRPQMCRSYPDGQECGFEECTMAPPTLEKQLEESIKLVAAGQLTKKVNKKR